MKGDSSSLQVALSINNKKTFQIKIYNNFGLMMFTIFSSSTDSFIKSVKDCFEHNRINKNQSLSDAFNDPLVSFE